MKSFSVLVLASLVAPLFACSGASEQELEEAIQTPTEENSSSLSAAGEETSAAPAGCIYMTDKDTDGDGALEKVYNCGTYIQITESNGSGARTYSLGTSWVLLAGTAAYQDTDGTAGVEIVANTTGGYISIICDKSRTIRRYYIASSYTYVGSAYYNTDSVSGKEIVLNLGSKIQILNDKTRSQVNWNVGSSWRLNSVYNQDTTNSGLEVTYYDAVGARWAINDTKNTKYKF